MQEWSEKRIQRRRQVKKKRNLENSVRVRRESKKRKTQGDDALEQIIEERKQEDNVKIRREGGGERRRKYGKMGR